MNGSAIERQKLDPAFLIPMRERTICRIAIFLYLARAISSSRPEIVGKELRLARCDTSFSIFKKISIHVGGRRSDEEKPRRYAPREIELSRLARRSSRRNGRGSRYPIMRFILRVYATGGSGTAEVDGGIQVDNGRSGRYRVNAPGVHRSPRYRAVFDILPADSELMLLGKISILEISMLRNVRWSQLARSLEISRPQSGTVIWNRSVINVGFDAAMDPRSVRIFTKRGCSAEHPSLFAG